MEIINLTPHTVTYIHDDGTKEEFPSQGVARAAVQTEELGIRDGYRITKSTFGAPVNLPEPREGVFLIVSLATANAAVQYGRTTDDLLLTNDAVRDSSGAIVGCKAFAVV